MTKIYTQLPEYLQTTAIKNFFEVTVEQLYSQSNVETFKGLIGTQRSDDYNAEGSFVREATATRHHYSLTPTVNTINSTTGKSDNFIFFDEFIDILDTYSVDVSNQNRLFGSKYQTFVPPIDIDKLINFQEYYWVPEGPTPIQVSGTLDKPIDIDTDIIGKKIFTPSSGITFKNGMVVKFVGEYVIPTTKKETNYIIQGVGENIIIVPLVQNFNTSFSIPEFNNWDATPFSVIDSNVVHTAGNITSVAIDDAGIGYVSPTIVFTGANTILAAATLNAHSETGAIQDVTVTNGGQEYSAPVGIVLSDINITHTIDVANTVVDDTGNSVFGIPVYVDTLLLDSVSNVIIGQHVTHANFTGTVHSITGSSVTLTEAICLDSAATSDVSFSGNGFAATVRTDMARFATTSNGQITVTGVSSAAFAGKDPNTGDFYLQGGEFAWDANGRLSWGGTNVQAIPDYLTIERGAENKNVWSRVNFWFHRDNFLDAGDTLPDREFRADRAILEYDRFVEMYNSGNVSVGVVNLVSNELLWKEINGTVASTLIDNSPLSAGTTIIFPNESLEISQYVWITSLNSNTARVSLTKIGDPATNPIGVEDGETGFIPFVFESGEQIQITGGSRGVGQEWYWVTGTGLTLGQFKTSPNQSPLFNLYNDEKQNLTDINIFPETTFVGSKIFGFAENVNGTNDPIYGFPLSHKPFKSSSEIEYENFIDTERVNYRVFSDNNTIEIGGYYYYKRLNDYHAYWKNSNKLNEQTIDTLYYIDRFDVSTSRRRYYIGCRANLDNNNVTGYDITIKVNEVNNIRFTYVDKGFIEFIEFTFQIGDVIEIKARSTDGLLLKKSISKYELPLSWYANIHNEEILTIAEPEYLQHFTNYMKDQVGFTGDSTGSNTFANTSKESQFATEIVKTDQDLILGAFLANQRPHNIIDALRFNSAEYEKYKNRLRSEITSYYNITELGTLTNEQILEDILRRLIAFSVGKEVFNRTYIVPYGDNFKKEVFSTVGNNKIFVLSNYENLDKIENSLLIYKVSKEYQTLLAVDIDYTITNFNPITIEINNLLEGDQIVTKLYNADRDSAQCPPTPSTMGLYPLFNPRIELDNTFQTPIDVLVGHDGSRIILFGDERDNIMFEFEKRIYNSAKAEFREANSIPELSVYDVRSGAFRNTNFDTSEWFDLLRTSFSNWTIKNKVDPIVNESHDVSNEFTWNYRRTGNIPGHWRGYYIYYYDTLRPHTHPWEMIGFFEKPNWWEMQYGVDYGNTNTLLWEDLESGIIRQGVRENVTNNIYLTNNPFRRIGLNDVIPVNSEAELISPYQIASTGSTTKTITWINNSANVSAGIATTSYLDTDGVNIGFDDSNVYIDNTEQTLAWNIPRVSLTNVSIDATIMPNTAIAVMIDGLPLYNTNRTNSWENGNVWHYNSARDNIDDLFYYIPESKIAGLDEWDNKNHSPIIGWAFDGLPIYGPYSYVAYSANGQIQDNMITNIKSSFKLRDGNRDQDSGPGGAYTGVFVEDYVCNPVLSVLSGYADKYNQRYGVTPDSPNIPIRYYITTIDDTGKPMFPYAVGGGGSTIYQGEYYAVPQDVINNTINNGYISSNATTAFSSIKHIELVSSNHISDSWIFGDNAPAENAWQYSEIYPFAVVEALFLSKPGKFATVFADPTQLISPAADPTALIDKTTRREWNFGDENNFRIHGDFDNNNNFITNIGYTPFIHSWLQFQGLDVVSVFVQPLRTISAKLGYRFAGFIDKNTMTLRTDQFSTTGDATSLNIPQENINVVVHTSPYKTRNYYSGVIIEQTVSGWKIRGYDRNYTYFTITESKTTGRRQEVERGGNPADFVTWKINTTFAAGTIVKLGNVFYQNDVIIQTGNTFDKSKWKRLASLPQVNAAKGIFYQEITDKTQRVDYETEFSSVQEVFDFLINLGKYQQQQGYSFGQYDVSINSVRNWLYAAEQFLFWTTGKWEIGNTLELSPMAAKIRFDSPRGFVGEIKRIDRNQFTLLDQDGIAISITDCEIFRENTSIEITPPTGKQIYACLLYTIEIEHAMTLDNITDFNDTMYNPLLNQKQTRLYIKAVRTAGWDGRFSSEGFIIQNDKLSPNLDNQADTLRRYYEIGFVPVEKDVYSSSRALFGYEDRSYLRDLDIADDDQFEFYKGLIQNKGTNNSLSRIAKSNAVIQGNITIFDEWALKVGEFGDVENEQSIELRLEKSEIVQDPQLVTLAFPEDTTGIVESIKVLYNKHEYFDIPIIEISKPSLANGIPATANAVLDSKGRLSTVNITNSGKGYTELAVLNVIAGNTVVQNVNTTFNEVSTLSSTLFTEANIAALGNITIVDHLATNETSHVINLAQSMSAANVVSAINLANANVSAQAIASHTGSNVISYVLQLTGKDFSIRGNGLANLNLTENRYQPLQRHVIDVANNTTTSNIVVNVDNNNVGESNWDYDPGDRWTIFTSEITRPGTPLTVVLNEGSVNGSSVFADENITQINNTQPYIDVFVNGVRIENHGFEVRYRALNNTTIIFDNISLLPRDVLSPQINLVTTQVEQVLLTNSNIFIVERATIDFTNAYKGDLPGSTLSVRVSTNDGIAMKIGSKRIFDITPDIKNDEVILIDIDDTTRFLKKPTGVKEHNLWPTTTAIDHKGLTDNAYTYVPNAGYVAPYTVDYQSFDIVSIPALFGGKQIINSV